MLIGLFVCKQETEFGANFGPLTRTTIAEF